MSAMGTSKSIIHVYIAQPCEFSSKPFDVFPLRLYLPSIFVLHTPLFLPMESNILAKEDLTFRVVYLVHYIISHAVIQEINGPSKQSLKRLGNWPQGVFHVPLSVGTAEVGEEHDGLGVMAGQMLESGDGS